MDITSEMDKPVFHSKLGLIGFFLCSFDNTYGLQILFSYPSKLQKDKNEINVLKTHCIWKIDKIPLRIDLKFSEFVYSALHLLRDLGDDTTGKRPIYGIVIKNWKDNDPIPNSVYLEFKTALESTIGLDLDLLYKRKKLASNPIRRREYNELSKRTKEIVQILKAEWKIFVNQANIKMESLEPPVEDQLIPSMIPVETSFCSRNLYQQKITMRVLSVEEDPDQLLVILDNQSEDFNDVLIQVSKRTEFFSEIVWEQELEKWPKKEDLILEFHRADVIQNYLIKISRMSTTIDIKSLNVGIANKL